MEKNRLPTFAAENCWVWGTQFTRLQQVTTVNSRGLDCWLAKVLSTLIIKFHLSSFRSNISRRKLALGESLMWFNDEVHRWLETPVMRKDLSTYLKILYLLSCAVPSTKLQQGILILKNEGFRKEVQSQAQKIRLFTAPVLCASIQMGI